MACGGSTPAISRQTAPVSTMSSCIFMSRAQQCMPYWGSLAGWRPAGRVFAGLHSLFDCMSLFVCLASKDFGLTGWFDEYLGSVRLDFVAIVGSSWLAWTASACCQQGIALGLPVCSLASLARCVLAASPQWLPAGVTPSTLSPAESPRGEQQGSRPTTPSKRKSQDVTPEATPSKSRKSERCASV